MRKALVFLCAMLLLCGIYGSAEAIPYLDVNGDHSGPVYMGQILNPSETWVFDLVNDTLAIGDINAGDTIDTALTRIAISGSGIDLGSWFLELADLSFDGTKILNNVEVDDGFYSFNVLAYVTPDYILNLTIDDVHSGCIYPANFTVCEINVSGDYTPAPVPEPATMLLLASGLVGLAGLRRFKKS